MSTCDARKFGAKADGKTDDTQALQAAIDNAAETGGTVVLEAGTYLTGTLYLKSNVTVVIEAGAVLKGIEDISRYPDIPAPHPQYMEKTHWKALLYARGQENITLRGEGTIDGSGGAECFQTGKGNDPNRPFGLHIVECRNVTVRDLTLVNSGFWMQRYYLCDGVHLTGQKVYNHSNHNNDGVDVDSSRNVVVSDCRIDSSDDALCFKSEGPELCENVTVTNCILSSFASAFKLGTGSVTGFRKFTVSNLVIRPSVAPNMSHPCNAWSGLMGIDLGNVDGGVLEDVLVSNVAIEGVETPIYMKFGTRWKTRQTVEGEKKVSDHGVFRNVRIDNVVARDVGPISSSIVGYEGHPIRDVVLSRIQIFNGKASAQKPSLDVETHPHQYPFNRVYNTDLPSYGLYLRYVEGLSLNDIRLEPAEGDPRTTACVIQDAKDVICRDFRAPGDQPFLLHDCTNVTTER
jgi:polygalacturonase